MVGLGGFEPPISWALGKECTQATRLFQTQEGVLDLTSRMNMSMFRHAASWLSISPTLERVVRGLTFSDG
jgi:hypothetical protein